MKDLIEYNYKAINTNGDIITEYRSATSEESLKKNLLDENLKLISIKKVSKFHPRILAKKMPTFGSVSEHEKIILNKNLSSMLEAGLPLSRCLEVLEKQTKNFKLKNIIGNINDAVQAGRSLSVAMNAYPKIFPPLVISMVQSGEESGHLAKALEAVGEQMEKSYNLKKKIRGAMAYPIIVIAAMFLIGIFMLIYVVPTLNSTFSELELDLPRSTQFIINFSNLIQQNYFLIIGLILLLIFLGSLSLKTKIIKRVLDWTLLKTPLVSPLVKEINTARTTRTLSSLLSAGVPFVKSVQIVGEVAQNSYYKDVLKKAEKNIQLGLPISQVFRDAEKFYPIFVSEMMIVGEETGELGKMLLKTANFYEKEVEQKTQNISTVVEPFLMIVVGIVVGFFVFSMIVPMYSLVETI